MIVQLARGAKPYALGFDYGSDERRSNCTPVMDFPTAELVESELCYFCNSSLLLCISLVQSELKFVHYLWICKSIGARNRAFGVSKTSNLCNSYLENLYESNVRGFGHGFDERRSKCKPVIDFLNSELVASELRYFLFFTKCKKNCVLTRHPRTSKKRECF